MRLKEYRQQDMLKLIENLDISPTMYHNATSKYKAVATYLQENGLVCDIFPQGSFSIGTVVRPYKGSKESNYDLDFICCMNDEKQSTTPKFIKHIVKETLLKSETYKKLLQDIEWDKCWTLEYADVNGIGFNVDIVPAVSESSDIKDIMLNEGLPQEFVEYVVAITNKSEGMYYWITNNARGYKIWFDMINKPFLEYNREERRKKIFEINKKFYNSIEDIPEEMERSSLQRVIQILKHHRDVYYCRINREDLKPTSAIITTLCAEIAQETTPALTVFELLQYITENFEIYSQYQTIGQDEFESLHKDKNVIRKSNEEWYIPNPVNPLDNLADSWNDNPLKAKSFFQWVKTMRKDCLETMFATDSEFVAMLENNFGEAMVKANIDLNEYDNEISTPIVNTPKPWRYK